MDVRIEIDDDLWKKVRAASAMDGRRNRDVVEDALTRYFAWRDEPTQTTGTGTYTPKVEVSQRLARPAPKPSKG